jgi:4-hydroxyphenylpyruvate dioxygenase-like putative hemolysin
MKFTNLLQKYIRNTPTYPYIIKNYFHYAFIDHIAHRSLDYHPIISHYERNGFRVQDTAYDFPSMNVEAKWMKYDKNPKVYRIFVSQYKDAKTPISRVINSYKDYCNIQAENDYVAWTMLHRFDINHLAIATDNIFELASKLKKDTNVRLNHPEDPIKISKDGKLLQMSTKADTIEYTFANGEVAEVPYAFVEFVQRIDGRDGFESGNAEQILLSTNLRQ